MYTTTVKIRKIPNDKTGLKLAAPLLIWFMAEMVFFYIAVTVKTFVISFQAMLIFAIIFFTGIPITYHLRKRMDEFRGKESFRYEEITFHTADGELYVDDIKLDATYNESKTAIFVDHIWTCKQKYGIKTMFTDFVGIVEEPYLKDFVRFLEEEGVTIHQE